MTVTMIAADTAQNPTMDSCSAPVTIAYVNGASTAQKYSIVPCRPNRPPR